MKQYNEIRQNWTGPEILDIYLKKGKSFNLLTQCRCFPNIFMSSSDLLLAIKPVLKPKAGKQHDQHCKFCSFWLHMWIKCPTGVLAHHFHMFTQFLRSDTNLELNYLKKFHPKVLFIFPARIFHNSFALEDLASCFYTDIIRMFKTVSCC